VAADPTSPDILRIDLAGWLAEFDLQDRTRGRDYCDRGCVLAMEVEFDPPRTIAAAVVRGNHDYECSLTHYAGEGWNGGCDCPVGDECKHLYALGTALLHQLTAGRALPLDPPAAAGAAPNRNSTVPPDEASLVDQFTAARGSAPERKQLAFLRNLLALFRGLRDRYAYFNFQALQNLMPPAHRYGIHNFYENPFADRWARPPASPLELWSHVALFLTEKAVPLPDFMAPVTDLAWAREAIATHRHERELAAWRKRFAALENSVASAPAADAPPPPPRTLRLRLAAKKPTWEISAPGPEGAPVRFLPIAVNELRELIQHPELDPFALSPAATTLVALLRSHFGRTNRLAVKFTDEHDREFLSRLLAHPLARECVVADGGQAIVRDARRLIWQIRDHPNNPDLVLAQLGFADGTPAPATLVHLPGRPDLYLHGALVFVGLPPPAPDLTEPTPIPRAALALPEAGRFAARAGVMLPGDATGRYRREALRPRLRARLEARRPDRVTQPPDEVLLLELAALAPDGTPRALLEEGAWRRSGPGLPPPPPDNAFLILDFEPLRGAVDHFHFLPAFHDAWHPAGPRTHSEITAGNFPETFAAWLAGFPPHTLVELAPELAAFAQAPTRAHFALDLTPGDESGIDWFDVRVTLRTEDTTLTPEDIALLHAARGRFVRLTGRGWRRLALDDSSATQEKLARLGLDPATAENAREPLRFHALQLADEALREALPEKLWAQVRERSAALRASAPPATPAGLIADLRPYQHEGFHFLAFLSDNKFGGILADDMGLGKTLQTLAWLLWLAAADGRDKKPFRALVVCPKSVVVNWQLETARFAPGLTTTAFTSALVTAPSGAKSGSSGSQLSTLNAQLLIANYTQLRLHGEALGSVAWDAVILDEGQNIKNPASATAQAARALRTAHRLVLTGTPVENRLLDLWSLFAFAQPGLLGGQTAFKRLYNDKADPAARTRLAQRVKHFLLRRTKGQVARDLPPRIEEELIVELEGEQRRLYDAELKRTRALLLGVKNNRDFDTQRFNILQSLLRLRQICCDPRLVGVGALPKPARGKSTAKLKAKKNAPDAASSAPEIPNSLPPPSAKLEALLDTLEPLVAERHKVLVFSQFVTMLELIRVELTARGIPHLMLTGQTENRQDLVNQFQADPAIPVFLLSLKAAGSGLNLTAASYVVLFDPWWNPAVEAQAIDRTHRIGQKNQVIAYRLIARDTVEEKIRALQKEKAALAAAVVQEESLASVLDLESLRKILG